MNIYILGSASGVQPSYRRRYTSWVLEEPDGQYLLFDVGAGTPPAAYCLGLDFLKWKAVFISHGHPDHTFGLPELIQHIKKQQWMTSECTQHLDLPIYTASPELVDACNIFMDAAWDYDCLHLKTHLLSSGEIYKDDYLSIDCTPTLHRNYRYGKPYCYGFRVRLDNGKNIVYTGDFKALSEFDAWMEQPCHLLLIETGHHRACELCRGIRERNWPVEKILFVHHGLDYLNNPSFEKAEADRAWGDDTVFAEDSMVYPLPW